MSTWEKYRDMIDLPYPGESKHTRMPVRDRAAQFAPFAALTGFGAVLKETERITEKRIELDEYEKENGTLEKYKKDVYNIKNNAVNVGAYSKCRNFVSTNHQ